MNPTAQHPWSLWAGVLAGLTRACVSSAGAPLGRRDLPSGSRAQPGVRGPGSIRRRTLAGAALHAAARPDRGWRPGQEVRGGRGWARHVRCREDGP